MRHGVRRVDRLTHVAVTPQRHGALAPPGDSPMPRKKSKREPTPMDEGAQLLEAATKAGADYAHEQVGSPHFNDWMIDQMVEAERMRKADPSSVIPMRAKRRL